MAESIVQCVRGATTVDFNNGEEILREARHLLGTMIEVNAINVADVMSVKLTATPDLDAEFPAVAWRQLFSDELFPNVDAALLDCAHFAKHGATKRCIRVLIEWIPKTHPTETRHVYLRGAAGFPPEAPEFDNRARAAHNERVQKEVARIKAGERGEPVQKPGNTFPKLHNAMWPGLVGKKSQGGKEADISLDRMLELTANAEVDGERFDGIDYFLFHPHTDPDASEDELKAIADKIAEKGLAVGSLVAPIWPGTVGGSAMGSDKDRENFVLAVEKACRIAKVFNEHGVRQYGVIRIDSAEGPANWLSDPEGNTKKIAETFRRAAKVAQDHGERLAAEGEICWAGMHTWKDMLNLLEAVGMPEVVGFQADQAHTYLYLLGYNAEGEPLLEEGYTEEQFYDAYTTMTNALREWTIDFHVAQNDGTVHGSGAHDKTGRHCQADDPKGKLNITKTAGYWLKDAPSRGIQHICWDGCMFPNKVLQTQRTWNNILATMLAVRDAHGWNPAPHLQV